jgi:hypothetical protein
MRCQSAAKQSSKKRKEVPAESCEMCKLLTPLCACVVATTPSKVKGTRRRSDIALLSNQHWATERSSPETHTQFLLRQPEKDIDEYTAAAQRRTKKAQVAAAASHEQFAINDDGDMFEYDIDTGDTLGEGMAAARRCGIAYFFEHVYGCPPEENWGGRSGIIHQVMRRMGIQVGSKAQVRKVFEDVRKARNNGGQYDVHSGPRMRGRKFIIKDDTPEAQVVYTAMEAGVGITETTVLVNEFRRTKNEDNETVSWSSIRNFIKSQHKKMSIAKRKKKKSGKADEGSAWALARLAQAQQIQKQLDLGAGPPPVPSPAAAADAAADPPLPPLFLDGIAWWDEFHLKVRLGHSSKYEVRLCRHPDTHGVCSEEEGGVWTEEKPTTSMKYPGEGRACAGTVMFKDEGNEDEGVYGGYKGVTVPLFNYTGRTVVGLKAWNQAKQAELARVKPLKMPWGNEGEGYEQRYGAN